MKILVAKILLGATLLAPVVSSAASSVALPPEKEKGAAPALAIPAHELNFTPSFASYPHDLTLLGGMRAGAGGTLRFIPGKFGATTTLSVSAGTLTLSPHAMPAVPLKNAGAWTLRPNVPRFDNQLPALPASLLHFREAPRARPASEVKPD